MFQGSHETQASATLYHYNSCPDTIPYHPWTAFICFSPSMIQYVRLSEDFFDMQSEPH